ncbi:mitochondrial carrier [Durotheca rogersii]|uniref:mitochondrial carrier n=1 Tax=Durotheca rogersii TaxID=419775 RepID=UPI0022207587|nr:mitochondrial carrier [Durotheca rogersii]KAI5862268.1 mitochondrial carrier [Durotheca rogersii]
MAAPSPSAKPVVPLPQNDNVAHALAGAGGGILSMVLTYPLITLSTRAQVESRRGETAFLAAVRALVAREGVAGLYAGLGSAVLGISVTNFVYYYWYEWTRGVFEAAARRAGRASRKLTAVEAMVAGALAGSATVVLTNPIWVVNTRMTTRRAADHDADPAPAADGAEESDAAASAPEAEAEVGEKSEAKRPPRPTTTLGTLLALLREEGPQALFRGVVPALVLVANPILQYTLFEQLRNAYERRRRRSATPAVAFVLGALGKLFATTITYPYIVVKSRMHVADAAAATADGRRPDGMMAALGRVIREEGYAGLYKGIGPKVTQSVLTAAFLFAFKDVLYEQTIRLRGAVARRAIKAA